MQLLEDNQQVVGVAGRDTIEEMASFVERHGLEDIVMIADPDGVVWERFGVFGQPAWGFVNGETGELSVRLGGLGRDGVLQAFSDRGFL